MRVLRAPRSGLLFEVECESLAHERGGTAHIRFNTPCLHPHDRTVVSTLSPSSTILFPLRKAFALLLASRKESTTEADIRRQELKLDLAAAEQRLSGLEARLFAAEGEKAQCAEELRLARSSAVDVDTDAGEAEVNAPKQERAAGDADNGARQVEASMLQAIMKEEVSSSVNWRCCGGGW